MQQLRVTCTSTKTFLVDLGRLLICPLRFSISSLLTGPLSILSTTSPKARRRPLPPPPPPPRPPRPRHCRPRPSTHRLYERYEGTKARPVTQHRHSRTPPIEYSQRSPSNVINRANRDLLAQTPAPAPFPAASVGRAECPRTQAGTHYAARRTAPLQSCAVNIPRRPPALENAKALDA